MYAIEFETDIQNGVVKIPAEYSSLKNKHARVVILLEDESTDDRDRSQESSELRAISRHSAGLVEEWSDLSEDDVWK